MTLNGHDLAQKLLPMVARVVQFQQTLHGHYYYNIRCLSDPWSEVQKKVFKEIMDFHFMIYLATPQHCKPRRGVKKFTILVDPSLVFITIYLVCLIHAQEQRRGFLENYINLALFTPKLSPLGVAGHEIYNFLFPYCTDATYMYQTGQHQPIGS